MPEKTLAFEEIYGFRDRKEFFFEKYVFGSKEKFWINLKSSDIH